MKSGDQTVGLLVLLKTIDPDRLAAVLARAEALARGATRRRTMPHWLRSVTSIEAVRALMAERA